MKIRSGFVSNSSSSSFIIPVIELFQGSLSHGLDEGKMGILNKILDKANEEGWRAKVKNGYLIATTYMDNFDLVEYIINNTEKADEYSFIHFPPHSGFNHGDIKVLSNIVKQGFYNLDHTP